MLSMSTDDRIQMLEEHSINNNKRFVSLCRQIENSFDYTIASLHEKGIIGVQELNELWSYKNKLI